MGLFRKKQEKPILKPLSNEERTKYEDEKLRGEVDELRKKRRWHVWAATIGGIVIAIGGIATISVQTWQHRREMREQMENRTTDNITTLILALGEDYRPQKRLAAISALEIYLDKDGYEEYREDIASAIGRLVNMESDHNVKDRLVSVATKLRRKGEEVTIALAPDVRKEIEEIRMMPALVREEKVVEAEATKEADAPIVHFPEVGVPREEVPAVPPTLPEREAAKEVKIVEVPKEIEKRITTLGERDVVGIDLSGQNLRYLNLSRASLKLANLEGADLFNTNLDGADLRDARLKGTNLKYAILTNATLESANLERADLFDANLEGANLSGALLNGAILKHAVLASANLASANLSGASLYDADLGGAELKGADFSSADLSHVDLGGVKNFHTVKLRGAS